MEATFDVIIVGGGGSGLAAAVSAAENGARVLVLEKESRLGGTTGIAVGSFTANRTRLQAREQIEDSPTDHAEDAGKFGPPEYRDRNNHELRQFFLENGGDTVAWLEDMGIAFHGPSPEPPNRVPRMHNVVPNAKAYIATLHARLVRLGGEVKCDTAVIDLMMHEGRVIGVEVVEHASSMAIAFADDGPAKLDPQGGQPGRYTARRGVILAGGDYSSATPLIERSIGARYGAIEGINPFAAGYGQILAERAGAELLNMDIAYGPELRFVPTAGDGFMQLLPTSGPLARLMGRLLPLVPNFVIKRIVKRLLVSWQHPEDSILEDGAILVNREGRRFCNETVGKEREIAVAQQPDKEAFILLDERLIKRYSAWPHFISTAPEIAYAYVDDYLRLRPDVSTRGPSLAEVAARWNLPVDALAETLEDYNRYTRGEAPDSQGRTGNNEPLQGSDWVLLGPAKAYFTTTEGGASVDTELRVLNPASQPIAGLYAVGQNGLGGQILWGHGLKIGWALTSGRLAGKIVAKAAPVESPATA